MGGWWVNFRLELRCYPISYFHSVLLVVNNDGYLQCSCGYMHRHGIPCRHLFAIEPEYDTSDIDVRWHLAYGYYAHSDGFSSLTEA